MSSSIVYDVYAGCSFLVRALSARVCVCHLAITIVIAVTVTPGEISLDPPPSHPSLLLRNRRMSTLEEETSSLMWWDWLFTKRS